MSSPKPEDPVRLSVIRATARIDSDFDVIVTVAFRYSPWEPGPAQDVLFEQINALRCVRDVLDRGGMADEL